MIVSGIVSHGCASPHSVGKWGFKITFMNTTDAIHMKPRVVKLLESEGYIVTCRKGYNE